MSLKLSLSLSLLIVLPALATLSPEEFRNPPPSARPHTWWHWMNGNVTKAGITADLEAMAAAGIGGAQIFDAGLALPKGPVVFATDAWLPIVRRNDLELNSASPTAAAGQVPADHGSPPSSR